MLHLIKILRERERELKALPYKSSNKSDKGFTLVELLIVIGILAALSAAVVVVINPTEMLRQGRDSTRMREINSIHRALSMFQVDRPSAPIGASNVIHVSIPSASSDCVGLGLPALTGWVYRCVTAENLRNINGTGWIPVDFTTMFQGSPLSHLPIDPTNTVASSNFSVFVTDGRTWTFASLLKSERHAPSAVRDGGTDSARFEVGNNLSLWTSASGLVGYWSFDEGSGITARDLSGRGNTGTLVNGSTWTTGRVGGALSFDGVNDHVDVGIRSGLTPPNITIEAWVRADRLDDWDGIISNMSAWGSGFSLQIGTVQRIAAMVSGHYLRTTWAPVTGVWYHIVATHDNATSLNILYVNGREEARVTRSIFYEANARTQIGVFYTSTPPTIPALLFNGIIDEVRIYNRALSAAEIMANFNATR